MLELKNQQQMIVYLNFSIFDLKESLRAFRYFLEGGHLWMLQFYVALLLANKSVMIDILLTGTHILQGCMTFEFVMKKLTNSNQI